MDTDGVGGVSGNHLGEWMVGFAASVPHVNCLTAELQALVKGLTLDAQMQLLPLEVETDAEEVTKLLHSDTSRYSNLLCDCRHILKMLHDPLVRHAYREQNGVEDQLAKLGSRIRLTNELKLFVTPPLLVSHQQLADQMGMTTQRMVPTTQMREDFAQGENTCFVMDQIILHACSWSLLARQKRVDRHGKNT
ncbi:uncharacterized protein [Nicotiana sylvestris]|uniref:uncharacterized protein n=1 Tax=Nicotiana sylvestris TaxID=4096 RepID=UPI00388C34F8